MKFVYNDGGRSKYFRAKQVGDCVVRAAAIATQRDYKEIYDLARKIAKGTPRNGLSKTHERFLMKIGYIMSLKYTDEQKQEILKNACWVDGTIAGQVQYAQEQRAKLRKSYSILRDKFVKLKIVKY